MTSKALAVLGLTAGLALALMQPAAADQSAARPGAAPLTALPSGPVTQAVTTRDLLLLTACYDPGGTGVSCATASVKVNLAVRGWYASSTASFPYKVDAAARGYDLGNTFVGNVQVEDVALIDTNFAVRSGPRGLSNSNGAATTGLITVPGCSVTTGTGRYGAQVTLSWRNVGTLYTRYIRAGWTTPSFRSTACTL